MLGSPREYKLPMTAMPEPQLDADQTALREWPGVRAGILDVAAAMDRLQRSGADQSEAWRQIHAMLSEIAKSEGPDRAERLLRLLSRGYDPAWRDRFAAGERSADLASDVSDRVEV